jgi:hypothetical protein
LRWIAARMMLQRIGLVLRVGVRASFARSSIAQGCPAGRGSEAWRWVAALTMLSASG